MSGRPSRRTKMMYLEPHSIPWRILSRLFQRTTTSLLKGTIGCGFFIDRDRLDYHCFPLKSTGENSQMQVITTSCTRHFVGQSPWVTTLRFLSLTPDQLFLREVCSPMMIFGHIAQQTVSFLPHR